MPARIASIIGLGFGDCGKGLFTDFLVRRWCVQTIVRFNGGAQAAHNVVLPDGRHHTFSQFGAGTFMAGVVTVLASPVIVNPAALLVEADYLERARVAKPLARLMIDARCRIVTPFHQAAGRLRELARGPTAHGTCGSGIGETVYQALTDPESALVYGDLVRPARAHAKLEILRRRLAATFPHAPPSSLTGHQREAFAAERAILSDASLAADWLVQTQPLIRTVTPASTDQITTQLSQSGSIVFEGAQGILLDEWHGFHPHTTWSSVGPQAVHAVLQDLGVGADSVHHFGVLRTYLTRHGHGPLPTHDASLDLPEHHNSDSGWQGEFRRGHPDAVLLRYALEVTGSITGLFVSHLDACGAARPLRWCSAYDAKGPWGSAADRDSNGRITRLHPSPGYDLAHQEALRQILECAKPIYDEQPLTKGEAVAERFAASAGLPLLLASDGPTCEHVRVLESQYL